MGNKISYQTSDCEVQLPGDKGRIKGLQFDNKSRRFANVAYALPPTDERRWRKPQPLPESYSYSTPEGVPFDGTKFGQVCLQPNYSASVKKNIPQHDFGEDCLRLNIWTPVSKDGESAAKWPVMVWFHGGWFQMGDPSNEPSMDPTEMISTGGLNAVFVAVGYRLNLFGFLAGAPLQEESLDGAVGNYGLWDQRLAMDWVYENISAFGGDPENITLSGRSAGAYAVQAQTLYDFRGTLPESSRNRFRRLVMYSNAIPAQPKTPEECQPQFDELCEYFDIPATSSGSEKLQRLRETSAKDLCEAIMKFKHHTFRPVSDDVFIHRNLFEYYRDGSFAAEFKRRGLRILIGEVLNEETLYAVTNGPEASLESLETQISNYYSPTTTSRLLQHYTLPTSPEKKDWEAVFGKIISDGQVRAPSRFLVNNLIENGVGIRDIWRYIIAYRLSFITDKVAPASFGVSHAMDRPFHNYSLMHGPTPAESQLMHEWIRDLVAFVNNESDYVYGTKQVDDVKVATPEGSIEIQKDPRWAELLDLMEVFAGSG
ncbi:Carboxylic ester hydrolase [Aspergillus mulundensis]|uniref:Carboxylic ester hydrolase n=1 Tax=Aspergillus mulundensis TaxID=1810919 RepID=A0A3D8QF81_9EURO|nr:Carboxylic ester hydrolase [Aspergillus mulundensis]RDW60489.1 Carboxylic ester hydrolase [Aspergillus mulundensis]